MADDGVLGLNPEFEAVLRECLDGLIGPEEPLQEDSDLAVFGIDSLTVVRLLVTIEEAFGVTIPDEIITFEIFSSPGALWNVVSGLLEVPDER
ncbi:phosphopantetheine-binding protein [Streptomyces sp. NPDC102441]|uniref:phosphopantetheine-binding protein n=1 Tax=Streptomyces sp. NPDC102441 TaxID=3366176 RepID=UPI00382D7F83